MQYLLPPLCLLSALVATAPLRAGAAESDAPAGIETTLDHALHELPPGIRAAALEASSPLVVEYTVDPALEAHRAFVARFGWTEASQTVHPDR